MPCRPFSSNGMTGFVCGPAPRAKKCGCGSGQLSRLLCDWKVEGGTCDAALCPACTHVPAEGKDLCPRHAAEWKARQAARKTPRP